MPINCLSFFKKINFKCYEEFGNFGLELVWIFPPDGFFHRKEKSSDIMNLHVSQTTSCNGFSDIQAQLTS